MVGLYLFVSQTFAQSWGVFAAGAIMGVVLIALIYIILQDQIVEFDSGRGQGVKLRYSKHEKPTRGVILVRSCKGGVTPPILNLMDMR